MSNYFTNSEHKKAYGSTPSASKENTPYELIVPKKLRDWKKGSFAERGYRAARFSVYSGTKSSKKGEQGFI
ncbi:MAG: hypothetical protein PHE73_08845 [Sulfurovaceae bacterium]|nr:hypothetical protein [Sulfurovaceae bacterium]